jgi:hypothetical protein
MRARGLLAAATVIALGLGGLAGCSKKLRPLENRPPETYVFVRGPVDTVNHRVTLRWYGTDPDGEVEAYAWRWVYPSQDPPPPWDTVVCVKFEAIDCGALRSLKRNPNPQDSLGRDSLILRLPQRIGLTDSLFTMFTGNEDVVNPRFEILAIDNECACDPTPAAQTFLLSNIAPTVRFTDPLGSRDSTYASVTVNWETTDPDGGGDLRYRIWLDGNYASRDSTPQRSFTVPSPRFLQEKAGSPGVFEYRSGPRTLYVEAVDDGGRSGPWASMTWYVRAPAALDDEGKGGLLVVDDLPAANPNNYAWDQFYASVYSLLGQGNYSVLRPQFNPRIFRSAADFAQTLRQHRAVLWYRGTETSVSPWLREYQDSLGAWLKAGGKAYLDGYYLVEGLNTPGAFREDFVRDFLGSTGLIRCYANISLSVKDSTAGWNFSDTALFRSSSYGDTALRPMVGSTSISNAAGGVRGFAVTDTHFVALWAMDGQLDPANVGFEVPVGVTVPHGTGRITLLSLPVRAFRQPIPWLPKTLLWPREAEKFLKGMLHEFGIGIPSPDQ